MTDKIKVGVLKETKTPPDCRVAITPEIACEILKKFQNVELFIQPSPIRTYTDDEYRLLGLELRDDLSNCDILIGIKEVKIPTLIPGKTYLYFSHTAKKQEHNRALLQATVKNKIRLIDYEYLTDKQGARLVAFGRWAGIVGAYNAIVAIGHATSGYHIRRAYECFDKFEFFNELHKVRLPNYKFLITGGGRVAGGAMEVLDFLKIPKVSPDDFLQEDFKSPVYAQLDPWHYVKRNDGDEFDWGHFSKNPEAYHSTFLPYTKVTDVFIPCHFWDPKSPVFMTREDMQATDFKMKLIADVSCDIDGPIPTTFKTSTIKDPFWGFNLKEWKETPAFEPGSITLITVDNLPGEAPRDASADFSKTLLDKVFPHLFLHDGEEVILRASITNLEGKLTQKFAYLQDFLDGK
jgi:saccharopine dehydrogenase (NAD+, L-lysine forming)